MAELLDLIGQTLKSTVPSLSSSEIDALVTRLTDNVGVAAPEDLKEVREQDSTTSLEPLQARKVIAVWSQLGEQITQLLFIV